MGSRRSDQPPRKSNKMQRFDNVPTHIFTPQTYQVELLDKALKRNTIVCLNNDCGMTFIMVLVIKELSHQLRTKSSRTTVLLVNSESSIEGYAQLLCLHTNLSVRSHSGDMAEWGSKKWATLMQEYQVLILPAETFLGALQNAYISLSQINLLVFDECHHACDDDHAYSHVMAHYGRLQDDPVTPAVTPAVTPRLLGFTSAVLSTECRTPRELQASLSRLEAVLHATAETSTDHLVADVYSAKPTEILLDCEAYEDDTGLLEEFNAILESSLAFLDDMCPPRDDDSPETNPVAIPRTAFNECHIILHSLGPWCCGKVAGALAKQVVKISDHETGEWGQRMLQFALTQLSMIDHIMSEVFDKQVMCIEDFHRYMSPKVRQLVSLLHDFKPDDNFMIVGSDGYISSAVAMEGEDEEEDDDEDPYGNDSVNFSDDDEFAEDEEEGTDEAESKKDEDAGKSEESPDDEKAPVHYVAKRKFSESSDGGKDPGLCGVVFVERRHAAFILNKLLVELCNWDPDLFFVKSHNIMDKPGSGGGGRRRKGKDSQLKRQEEILRKFRQKEYNLLISTAVLEEGVELPRCNLVVRFDLPADYRAYVQSKGRCRAPQSKFYMLVPATQKEAFAASLQTFRDFEKILLSKLYDGEAEAELAGGEEDALVPPYYTQGPGQGAKVTLANAIMIVNRYCVKLPSDAFTHLTPKVSVEVTGSSYRATLQLPINSPVKRPIVGPWLGSRRLALMGVAHKACVVLHQEGELDSELLPIGKEVIRYEDEDEEWEETEGAARPGTTKRKQYYLKRVARPLLGQPVAGRGSFLYRLTMTLRCPITEEQNTRGRRIHAPEDSPRSFGIVSQRWMPLVPHFPVFTRSGEVTVSVDLVGSEVVFSAEQLARLLRFQRFVFAKVLRLEKDPMCFDPEAADSSYILAPLNKGETGEVDVVDWPFIDMLEKSQQDENGHFPNGCVKRAKGQSAAKTDAESAVPAASASPQFVFRRSDFEDAVVMPSYRNMDQPQYFYVAEIRADLTPRSAFPSPELYDTFEAYYTHKYNLRITDPGQPLLDVDHTSARLNLLTPRYMNQKGVALPVSSAETRRARRENLQQKQILVPELCARHAFPAALWRKAVCVPALLYRLNHLLVAGEIRDTIAREACIGVAELDPGFRFPELEFGFSTSPSAVSYTGSVKDGEKAPDDAQSVKEINHTDAGSSAEVVNGDEQEDDVSDVQESSSERSQTTTIPQISDLPQSSSQCANGDALLRASERCENEADRSLNSESSHNGLVVNGHAENQNANDCCKCGHKSVSNVCRSEREASTTAPTSQSPTCNCDNRTREPPSGSPCSRGGQTMKRDPHHCEVKDIEADQTNCKNVAHEDVLSQRMNSVTLDDETGSAGGDRASEKTGGVHQDSEVSVHQDSEEASVNAPPVSDSAHPDEPATTPLVSFDHEEDLATFVGPSPCIILQSLTMSNANDFFNLERLETIGDSFLKFAVTVYLYCQYPGIHEGKLSFLRSKQVSNYNLYKLGKKKNFPDAMIACKFEPTENWLPPGYTIKKDGAFNGLGVYIASTVKVSRNSKTDDSDEGDGADATETSNSASAETGDKDELCEESAAAADVAVDRKRRQQQQFNKELELCTEAEDGAGERAVSGDAAAAVRCLIPYNLQTQHSLPDKSIADCVEALIGCYLVTAGQQAALQFMSWLGLKVLPEESLAEAAAEYRRRVRAGAVGSAGFRGFGTLQPPPSPLITHGAAPTPGSGVPSASAALEFHLDGYDKLEDAIQYKFRDRAYLLQAFTHASYHYNTSTDCYQRLEFLGDAILDYVITRHLYEDAQRRHSPGVLTDLRSALVNNNIFAVLAVKWGFHKYFKAVSPQLFTVIEKFVNWQNERGEDVLLEEELDACDSDDDDDAAGAAGGAPGGVEKEDIEIPKALGDIFESVAGAVYLDSGMALDTVWRVYHRLMQPHIDAFIEKIPKSPVRELLEMEPETAKFLRPERTMNGKIRVTVTLVGKGTFKGVGRNYRIAKSAAAKRALKFLRLYHLEVLREQQKYAAMAARAMSADFML